MTKASLNYTGEVVWKPPAIYKSSCKIDVAWFPFDEQSCDMKFGSWTYDGYQVDLKHIQQVKGTNVVDIGIDLKEFYLSVEWDILAVPATRNEEYYGASNNDYKGEPTDAEEAYGSDEAEEFHEKLLTDITFMMTLRRKTLFYTVNLIIPCVGISFLTVLVFYLPSDSGEKVTLCISILLSLTVFFLLLAEIIPPTSLAVPLLGKYLLFTMILVTLSICVTVGVLNIHFRSPSTHRMSPWVRKLFIQMMPKLLFMERPNYMPRYTSEFHSQQPPPHEKLSMIDNSCTAQTTMESHKMNGHAGNEKWGGTMSTTGGLEGPGSRRGEDNYSMMDSVGKKVPLAPTGSLNKGSIQSNHHSNHAAAPMAPAQAEEHPGLAPGSSANTSVANALKGVEFIAQHIKDEDRDNEVIEDWKFIAMVLDRFFLWVFTATCLMGTIGIIMRAPSLYDPRIPIDAKLSEIPTF